MKRMAVVVGVCAVGLLAPALAMAQTMATPADEALCDMTPGDGSWTLQASGVDMELTILGLEPHHVSVPGAVAGCANRWPYFDGTMISVGLYLMASDADAQAANEVLRDSAGAATTVEDLPALGGGAWIASFEFAQLAFTQVGPYLIGGMSDEAYEYSRDDYTEMLLERMGHMVEAATDEVPNADEPGEVGAGTHPETVRCVCEAIPPSLPRVLLGGGTAAATGAVGIGLGLPGRFFRRRR